MQTSQRVPPGQRWPLAGALLWLAAGIGCSFGPDYTRPETAAHGAEGYVNALEDGSLDRVNADRWWERFADPVVADLVDAALSGNADLKGAAARVLEAQAFVKKAFGDRMPDVTLSVGAERSKFTFIPPGGERTGVQSTTFSHDLSASYQVDLFGKLSRTHQAAWADLLATRQDERTVIHSIIASVVRGRVRVGILEKQLDLARANTESWKKTLEVVERRYDLGIAGSLDLRLARENLAASLAGEPTLEAQLHMARHGLDILVGVRPATGAAILKELPPLPDLEPIPVGLPAALLDRRPDLRAAELRLMAANARVGASIADLYPSLRLTSGAGVRSDALKNLLSSDGLVYSAVAGLAAPIFSGGKRRAEVRAARARYEQAAAAYAGVVLTALREVEDALVTEEASLRRLCHLETRLKEAQAAERLAGDRYSRGLDTLLIVLETQRRRRLAQTELVLTQGDLWTNRIDLFLALGGDWTASNGGLEDSNRAQQRGPGRDAKAPQAVTGSLQSRNAISRAS